MPVYQIEEVKHVDSVRINALAGYVAMDVPVVNLLAHLFRVRQILPYIVVQLLVRAELQLQDLAVEVSPHLEYLNFLGRDVQHEELGAAVAYQAPIVDVELEALREVECIGLSAVLDDVIRHEVRHVAVVLVSSQIPFTRFLALFELLYKATGIVVVNFDDVHDLPVLFFLVLVALLNHEGKHVAVARERKSQVRRLIEEAMINRCRCGVLVIAAFAEPQHRVAVHFVELFAEVRIDIGLFLFRHADAHYIKEVLRLLNVNSRGVDERGRQRVRDLEVTHEEFLVEVGRLLVLALVVIPVLFIVVDAFVIVGVRLLLQTVQLAAHHSQVLRVRRVHHQIYLAELHHVEVAEALGTRHLLDQIDAALADIVSHVLRSALSLVEGISFFCT